MKTTKKYKAFTLIELLISFIISSIVLVFVFTFVSDTISTITYSINKTRFITQFDDFITKINNYKLIYNDNVIVIDTVIGNGADVLLFKDDTLTTGVLFGIVSPINNKLSDNFGHGVYGDRIIGYRELNAQDLLDFSGNPNIVFDYAFHQDKIFQQIKVKEFQVELFNGGSIINLDIEVNFNYNKNLDGEIYSDLPNDTLDTFNLNF